MLNNLLPISAIKILETLTGTGIVTVFVITFSTESSSFVLIFEISIIWHWPSPVPTINELLPLFLYQEKYIIFV